MDVDTLTISQLAKRVGLSRSTLLYYERIGLITPRRRSMSNYRLYGSGDVERLEQVCLYREMGVPLKEIRSLLSDDSGSRSVEILRRRLTDLAHEITRLRQQQRCIVQLLGQDALRKEPEMVNKDRWVEIMRSAGFNDENMHNWHRQFEKMEPDAHQEFLESLGIKSGEIDQIRQWSCAN